MKKPPCIPRTINEHLRVIRKHLDAAYGDVKKAMRQDPKNQCLPLAQDYLYEMDLLLSRTWIISNPEPAEGKVDAAPAAPVAPTPTPCKHRYVEAYVYEDGSPSLLICRDCEQVVTEPYRE